MMFGDSVFQFGISDFRISGPGFGVKDLEFWVWGFRAQ